MNNAPVVTIARAYCVHLGQKSRRQRSKRSESSIPTQASGLAQSAGPAPNEPGNGSHRNHLKPHPLQTSCNPSSLVGSLGATVPRRNSRAPLDWLIQLDHCLIQNMVILTTKDTSMALQIPQSLDDSGSASRAAAAQTGSSTAENQSGCGKTGWELTGSAWKIPQANFSGLS